MRKNLVTLCNRTLSQRRCLTVARGVCSSASSVFVYATDTTGQQCSATHPRSNTVLRVAVLRQTARRECASGRPTGLSPYQTTFTGKAPPWLTIERRSRLLFPQ